MLAEKLGGRLRVVSLIGSLKRSSGTYNRLIEAGYPDDRIPLWVNRGDDSVPDDVDDLIPGKG